MNNLKLTILTIVATSVLAACNRGTQDVSVVKAVQGIPNVYAGIFDPPSLRFYEMENGKPVIDLATGKPKIRHSISVGQSSSAMKLLGKDGQQLGYELAINSNTTFSFFSNNLWTCSEAEKAVGRTVPLETHELAEDASCYVEINTTGDSGFAMTVIGLPEGKGIENFVNTNKPVLTKGELRSPTDGPAGNAPLKRVNAEIDTDFALQAMTDMAAYFSQNDGNAKLERNTCLKNQRAIGWTDLQAHFYCQLPLDSVRTCYATKLVDTAKRLGAGIFDLQSLEGTMCQVPALEMVNPFCIAYDACLKQEAYFSTHAEATLHQNQFFYIMFNKQGAKDFNIESENEVINRFYGVTDTDPTSPTFDGSKRPRRILDTYPNWLPDQPRYNKIRELQLDTQIKLGVAAGGQ